MTAINTMTLLKDRHGVMLINYLIKGKALTGAYKDMKEN